MLLIVLVAPHAGAWIETSTKSPVCGLAGVAPHAGAWIETAPLRAWSQSRRVAPHAGAWIETMNNRSKPHLRASHPMRVRGLKLLFFIVNNIVSFVAPHAGAWIETPVRRLFKLLLSVAPHAGALVEVQIAIQCWGVCIGVALAVGYETTADGTEFHPPLFRCAAVRLERKVVAAAVAVRLCEVWHRCRRLCCGAWRGRGLSRGGIVGFFGFPASDACVPAVVVFAAFDVEA